MPTDDHALKIKGSTIRASSREFDTDVKGLRSMLDEWGVAVIPGVLTEEDRTMMIDGVWNALEEMTEDTWPIKRDDPATWGYVRELFLKKGLLLQDFGIGTAEVSTKVRCLPRVIEPYEELYQTKELLSSMDGMSVFLPKKDTKYLRDPLAKPHTDEAFNKSKERHGGQSFQSWVTPFDVGPKEATLLVLTKSYILHTEFGKTFGLDKSEKVDKDFYELKTMSEVQWFLERGCELVRITCPAGSQVFWNSKTFHCPIGPVGGNQSTFRMVIYTCYTPRSWATDENMKKRAQIFRDGGTLSHRADIANSLSKKGNLPKRTYSGPNEEKAKKIKMAKAIDLDDLSLRGWELFSLVDRNRSLW